MVGIGHLAITAETAAIEAAEKAVSLAPGNKDAEHELQRAQQAFNKTTP